MAKPVTVFSTASELLAALRRRELSTRELLDLHLAQIKRYNSTLNAVVMLDEEGATQAANAADERRRLGHDAPLLGLPYTVKDWLEVAGLPSTAGDPDFTGYRAKVDGRVVARCRAAGGVFLGKTNMAVWGGDWITDNSVFGRTNNPWNLDHTPGGSTGGGAAAVAAGLTPLEWGNDIGGSVRIPPAFCGIYGHKPSETLLPRTGQTPDPTGRHLPNPARGLAVVGPLARSAEDLDLALAVAAGPDQGEEVAWQLALPPARHTTVERYRVAVMPSISWLPVHEEILAAQEQLLVGLQRLGVQAALAQPETFADLRDFYKLYVKLAIAVTLPPQITKEKLQQFAEAYQQLAAERNDEFMAAGGQVGEAMAMDYLNWFAKREDYRAAYRNFFKEWDLLLTPVTITPAFRHSDAPFGADRDDITLSIAGQPVPYMRNNVYPSLATLCGQPATAFPFGLTRAGLPIGLQAIGPYLEDRTPLRFAALVAQAFGGYQQPPGYLPPVDSKEPGR